MATPIFLSVARPQRPEQDRFLRLIVSALEAHGLRPHTVGVTEPCSGSPLPAIRRLISEVSGLAVVAFRRAPGQMHGEWRTSLFCQLEMAMAYQSGLPILIARERGVVAEGMLEAVPGIWELPELDLDQPADTFPPSAEWQVVFEGWLSQLRQAQRR